MSIIIYRNNNLVYLVEGWVWQCLRLTVVANLMMVVYTIVGLLIFAYHLGEAWLSGNPLGAAWNTTLGIVYGLMWPAILVGFLIWIIWDVLHERNYLRSR